MSSKYQMWLTFNGETEKLRFPVLPESVTVKYGSSNKSVSIAGLGEIVIKQDRPAIVIEFSSFFPATPFPGIQVTEITPPETLKEKITGWKNSDKPAHFLITGTPVNINCAIEAFTCTEQGGDIGTVHYSLTLREYREVSARQIKIDEATQTALLPADTGTRTDNRVRPATHTVVKGDCLWNIAAKYLGSGSKYTEIAALNSDIIKNPNLIYVGQVLRLPA